MLVGRTYRTLVCSLLPSAGSSPSCVADISMLSSIGRVGSRGVSNDSAFIFLQVKAVNWRTSCNQLSTARLVILSAIFRTTILPIRSYACSRHRHGVKSRPSSPYKSNIPPEVYSLAARMPGINDSKCVLIVGATAGIGRALALAIHALPSKPTVIVAGRRKERLDELVKKGQESDGGRIEAVQVDISAGKDALKGFSEEVISKFPEVSCKLRDTRILYVM